MKILMLTACCIMLLGCSPYRRALEATVDALNKRQAQGCLLGDIIAGGGFGGSLNAQFRFVTAVGGIDPAICTRGLLID